MKQSTIGGTIDSLVGLEFTPLEFETKAKAIINSFFKLLEFTPLEFETVVLGLYRVVWECLLEFTPLEFETRHKI